MILSQDQAFALSQMFAAAARMGATPPAMVIHVTHPNSLREAEVQYFGTTGVIVIQEGTSPGREPRSEWYKNASAFSYSYNVLGESR